MGDKVEVGDQVMVPSDGKATTGIVVKEKEKKFVVDVGNKGPHHIEVDKDRAEVISKTVAGTGEFDD